MKGLYFYANELNSGSLVFQESVSRISRGGKELYLFANELNSGSLVFPVDFHNRTRMSYYARQYPITIISESLAL